MTRSRRSLARRRLADAVGARTRAAGRGARARRPGDDAARCHRSARRRFVADAAPARALEARDTRHAVGERRRRTEQTARTVVRAGGIAATVVRGDADGPQRSTGSGGSGAGVAPSRRIAEEAAVAGAAGMAIVPRPPAQRRHVDHAFAVAPVPHVALVGAALHVGGAVGALPEALRAGARPSVAPEVAAIARARTGRTGGLALVETEERGRSRGRLATPAATLRGARARGAGAGARARERARTGGAVDRAAIAVAPAARAEGLTRGRCRPSVAVDRTGVVVEAASLDGGGVGARAGRREIDVFRPTSGGRNDRQQRREREPASAHGSATSAHSAACRVTGASSKTSASCT